MRDGSTKLILATAGLVGVWVVTYWLWPAPDRPPAITFDETSLVEAPLKSDSADSVAVPPVDAATTAPPTQPSSNPIGSELEPAPQPDFPALIPPEFDEHVVGPGETIWSIAVAIWGDRNLGGVIARANPTVDPKRLKEGTRLLIPKDPGNIQGAEAGAALAAPEPEIIEYVVEAGDTLGAISMQFYGTTRLWTRIRDANPVVVSQEGDVRVGATLLIPPPPESQEDPS